MSDPTLKSVPRLWRRDDSLDRRGGEATRRRRAIFALQAAIMALTGAIMGMLFWITPSPYPRLIPLFVARHVNDRLPAPPFARDDLRNLDGRWYFPGIPTRRPKTKPSLTGRDFREELARLATTSDRRGTVVVYVRANATVLPVVSLIPATKTSKAVSGEPTPQIFILPADADPADPAVGANPPPPGAWLPLDDLLDALRRSNAREKLLVLDLSPIALPRAGALDADLAAHLPAALERVADPRRMVLTSCGPGEVPLASDDLGRSVFGYYFEEALRGWAEGADGLFDGIVSVKDVASFLAHRVDDWARSNRGTRQRPTLVSAAPRQDFSLELLDRGQPRPHLNVPLASDSEATHARLAYPDWLAKGWAERDRWRAEGLSRAAPRAFRAVEATLLRAEEDWRNHEDSAALAATVLSRFAQYRRDWAVALDRPRPGEYRSLALAASLGVAPAAGLVDRVETLRRELTDGMRALKPADAEAARDARIKKFLDAEAADAEGIVRVIRALLTVGASATANVESIDQLDRVLRAAVARLGPGGVLPAEAYTLRRLAEQAASWPRGAGQPEWPAEVAQKLLFLADRAAETGARPRWHAWLGGMFDTAGLTRHDAEILFRESGYATLDAARERLATAASEYEGALAAGRDLEAARDTLTEALDLLPDVAERLDDHSSIEEFWLAATTRARALTARLATPAAPFRSAAELAPTLDGISRLSDDLRDDLDAVRGAIDRRIAGLLSTNPEDRSSDRVGADVLSIERLLSSSLPTAPQRLRLWQTARRLARPLVAATRALEERTGFTLDIAGDEDAKEGDSSSEDADEAETPTAAEAGAGRPLATKARRALALLGLAGAPETVLTPLQAKLQPDPSTVPAANFALSVGIRTAWDVLAAPEQTHEWNEPDVLGLVLPPLEHSPVLHVPKRSPFVLIRARAWEALWLRLANRYEIEANDLDGERALAETAAWLRDQTERMLADLSLDSRLRDADRPSAVSAFPPSDPPSAALSREKPAAQIAVRLRDDDTTPAWEVAPVALNTHWLAVRRIASVDTGPRSASLQNWLVELGSELASSSAPSGFLLRADRPGRHFFQRVPVSFDLDATQPRVILSADADEPTLPRRELRLRPLPGNQPFHLYLANPGDRDRKLLVELRVANRAVIGGSGVVMLGRGETRKIDFAKPDPAAAPVPAPPAAGTPEGPVVLPELSGALSVLLRDPDTNQTLVSRTIPVSVASPLEYVSVESAKFEPAGPLTDGKNRLTVTLRAAANFAGPPCVARLVLSPDRIPGLSSVRDTTSKGALEKPGDLLTLTAEGLVLADSDVESGTFSIDLDGVPRALIFRGSFPRRGGATLPVLDFTPALRAQAADVTASGGRYAVVTLPDNAPSDAKLEIRIGRAGLVGFEPDRALPVLPSPRKSRIGFALRDKALVFSAAVSDWIVPVDTEGVEGRRQIQIRLVNDVQTIREVVLPLAVDRSAARDVRFLDPPTRAKPGATVTLRAAGLPSTSGTKEVVFFPGKPSDGKIPTGAATVNARASDDDPTIWEATLALPEKKGPTEFSVAFVNAVGLASFDTIRLELTDADLTEPGRIAGRITERGVGQPELAVLLADEKGFQKGATKTDATGRYSFSDVPPGKYRVLSRNTFTPSKADTVIEVKSGQLATADLNLRYGR